MAINESDSNGANEVPMYLEEDETLDKESNRDIISRDITIMEEYKTRKKIKLKDVGQITELARVGLITKKLDLATFEMTAEISSLGRDLLGELTASRDHDSEKSKDGNKPKNDKSKLKSALISVVGRISIVTKPLSRKP